MGHQGDCLGIVFGAVFDSRQSSDNALIVGDFVGSSLLLRNLPSQLSISGAVVYIEVNSIEALAQLDRRD